MCVDTGRGFRLTQFGGLTALSCSKREKKTDVLFLVQPPSWLHPAFDPERAADDSRLQTLISRFISTTLRRTAAHTKLLTACKHAKKDK